MAESLTGDEEAVVISGEEELISQIEAAKPFKQIQKLAKIGPPSLFRSYMHSDGMSPLHKAAANGDVVSLNFILDTLRDHKFDLVDVLRNGDDLLGRTPLHYAAKEGRMRLVKILVKEGGDLVAEDKYKQTPFHLAASEGQQLTLDFMRDWLIEHGDIAQAVSALKMQDIKGNTALHLATINEKWVSVKPLLILPEAKELLYVRDNDGRTAIHKAAECDSTALLKQLVAYGGVDVELLEADDYYGLRPVDIAAGKTKELVVFDAKEVERKVREEEGDFNDWVADSWEDEYIWSEEVGKEQDEGYDLLYAVATEEKESEVGESKAHEEWQHADQWWVDDVRKSQDKKVDADRPRKSAKKDAVVKYLNDTTSKVSDALQAAKKGEVDRLEHLGRRNHGYLLLATSGDSNLLHIAIKSGNKPVVDYLLGKPVAERLLVMRDSRGKTPIDMVSQDPNERGRYRGSDTNKTAIKEEVLKAKERLGL